MIISVQKKKFKIKNNFLPALIPLPLPASQRTQPKTEDQKMSKIFTARDLYEAARQMNPSTWDYYNNTSLRMPKHCALIELRLREGRRINKSELSGFASMLAFDGYKILNSANVSYEAWLAWAKEVVEQEEEKKG